jgi:hypothetical protein
MKLFKYETLRSTQSMVQLRLPLANLSNVLSVSSPSARRTPQREQTRSLAAKTPSVPDLKKPETPKTRFFKTPARAGMNALRQKLLPSTPKRLFSAEDKENEAQPKSTKKTEGT